MSEQPSVTLTQEEFEAAVQEAAKKPPKPKKVTVSDPSAGQPVDSTVSGAFHVYRVGQQPDGQVRALGTRYRGEFGPSVLVLVHLHHYGELCTYTCRERVVDA